jgi:hypothetical protein
MIRITLLGLGRNCADVFFIFFRDFHKLFPIVAIYLVLLYYLTKGLLLNFNFYATHHQKKVLLLALAAKLALLDIEPERLLKFEAYYRHCRK